MADAARRSAEPAAFTAQLHQVASTLVIHNPSGACDAHCGCMAATASPVAVTLGRTPRTEAPISCTLGAADIKKRCADWQDVLSHLRARHTVSSGLGLGFDASAPAGAIAPLAATEQERCTLFDFTLRVDRDGIALAPTRRQTRST